MHIHLCELIKADYIDVLIEWSTTILEKRKFLLIHGAWHTAKCWDSVVPLLRAAGHEAEAIDLPGRSTSFASAWNISINDHAEAIVSAASKLNGPVTLVGHSLGGLMISAAAEKKPELFRNLVYLCAFLPKDGDSLMSLTKNDKGSKVPTIISPSLLTCTIRIKNDASDVFYNDCTPDMIELAHSQLVAEPARPTLSKLSLTDERFGTVSRSYILCTEDQAISIDFQKQMLTRQSCEKIATLNTSHSPFLSQPNELVDALINVSN